jgi:hypothetical protein
VLLTARRTESKRDRTESRMNRMVLVAATAMIFGSTVSAQAVQGGGIPPGTLSSDGVRTPIHRHATASGAEGAAEDLVAQGKCDQAVPILRGLAGRAGYEISEFHLGQCLLTLADAEHDAAHTADMRKEGAAWILRAAGTGFAEAEAEAIPVCLDGVGVEKDPVEAEKWALLYRHNGMRLAIGLPDIAPDLSSRLDAALNDAARAQAQARADGWAPTAQAAD